MMHWVGHRACWVLDGGWQSWLAATLPVSTEVPSQPRSSFQMNLNRALVASESDLLVDGVDLVDSRAAARYRGESEPIDPVAGHIPGAQCATFTDNLSHGRFRPPAELKARFEAMGIGLNDPLVCYCGSGVTATHNILALLLAGYPEPALYPDSWSGWITDPSRPVATGP